MTLQYQFNNVTLPAATGLPTPTARLASVLALSGIAGIYMFEDGAVGSSITTALDVSGLNNHGVVRAATGGYVVPTRTALGASIPAGDSTHNGTVFDTPISRTDAETGFTVIYGAKIATPAPASGQYPATGIVDSSLKPLGNATYNTLSAGPLSVARSQQLTGGSNYEGGIVIDNNGSWFTNATQSYPPISTAQAAGLWDLCAVSLNTTAKTVTTLKNGVVTTEAQALKSGFVAPADQGKFSFGLFLVDSINADPTVYRPTGQLSFVVICTNPNTDAAIQAAMTTLTSVMSKRGATFGAA